MKAHQQHVEALVCAILGRGFFVHLMRKDHKNLSEVMKKIEEFEIILWMGATKDLETGSELTVVFYVDAAVTGWESISCDNTIGLDLIEKAKKLLENINLARHSDPKIESALKSLLKYIASGYEYPDAIWKVTSSSGVSSEALGTAYDEYCANK